MEAQQKVARSIRMMKIGGLLTACAMVAVFITLLVSSHSIWVFFLVFLSFLCGAVFGASLINAFVVTRFLAAASQASSKTPPQ